MKKKYFLFLAFLFIFLFLGGILAHAATNTKVTLEVKYPTIPGLPSLNGNNPDVNAYVGYFFGLGVFIVGFLSLISFTIGAVGLIASADNPEIASNAKDRMKGAILGLVLTVASFVIINTLDHNLVTPTLTPLPGVAGVFYTNGSQDKTAANNPDTSTIPTGFTSIKYVCSGSAPDLLIWFYPNKNYLGNGTGGFDGINVKDVACNSQTGIGGASFQLGYQTSGIYYYLGSNCSGYASTANTSDQNSIGAPFKANIKSVKIVNDADDHYGIIFHENQGLQNGGICQTPIIDDTNNSDCESVNIQASAADIFEIEDDSAGDGVAFYSEPYGWDTGADAGYFNVPDESISAPTQEDPTKMCFDYTNVDRPDEYEYKCSGSTCGNENINGNTSSNGNGNGSGTACSVENPCTNNDETCINGFCGIEDQSAECSESACETFGDCPGSIKLNGTYLVALYSKNSSSGSGTTGGSGSGACGFVDGTSCTMPDGKTSGTCQGGACVPSSNGGGSSYNKKNSILFADSLSAINNYKIILTQTQGGGCMPPGSYTCPEAGMTDCGCGACCTGDNCCQQVNGGCPEPGMTNCGGGSCCTGDNCCQQNGNNGPSYCQTFINDVENLNTEPFLASGQATLGSVYVIPTK